MTSEPRYRILTKDQLTGREVISSSGKSEEECLALLQKMRAARRLYGLNHLSFRMEKVKNNAR